MAIMGQHEGQEGISEAGPFYPDKLMITSVPRSVTKELLVNYLESITGQDHTQLQYCDEPGDALVTFKGEIGK